jgi:hypothetical protein
MVKHTEAPMGTARHPRRAELVRVENGTCCPAR